MLTSIPYTARRRWTNRKAKHAPKDKATTAVADNAITSVWFVLDAFLSPGSETEDASGVMEEVKVGAFLDNQEVEVSKAVLVF